MITIKTAEEIRLMADGGKILREILQTVAKEAKPGVTTAELDQLTRKLVFSFAEKYPLANIKPSFLGYRGYPAFICISINDEVVHGIPSAQRVIQGGDLVSLDFGIIYHGWHTDSALTVGVGKISKASQKLMAVTEQSLRRGIKEVQVGQTVGDIGYAIQKEVEKNGFGVVRELVGHGVGRKLHEEPYVPNYGKKGEGEVLKEGMVIAIEPMVTAGNPEVVLGADGWTYCTKDQSRAAHFEHTIAITPQGPQVLT